MNFMEYYGTLTDDELHLELLRVTNDSYLLCSSDEQAEAHYHERHTAIWSELQKRGLVQKEQA